MLPEGVGVVGGGDGLVSDVVVVSVVPGVGVLVVPGVVPGVVLVVPVVSGGSIGVLVVTVVSVVSEVLVVSGGPDGPTKGTSSVLCHIIYNFNSQTHTILCTHQVDTQ